MVPIYTRIRNRAREIAAQFPTPDFYIAHDTAQNKSIDFFETDKVIADLKAWVGEYLDNDFGHGMHHAVKVTIDAGALMFVEVNQCNTSPDFTPQHLRLVQSAGLLHDIKRKHKNHAHQGAHFAREILKNFSFPPDDIEDICHAIRSHEAFKKPLEPRSSLGSLVSGCLYDADKFRWGPDNFKYMIWDMVAFSNIPFPEFARNYPKGMDALTRIKESFRTQTGQIFGPEFIEIGLKIGALLHDTIQTEFSDYL
jgi:hypothetical protein